MTFFFRCTLLCVFFLLLGTSLAPDADAQSRKERHRIRVAPEGEGCVYHIQDQANQDLFVVSPGGLVTVQARGGLWVDVFVEDDPRGVPGTRNRRMLALRKQVPRDTLVARGAVGRSTEHRVQIQCCTSRARGRACPRWSDAQPRTTDTGSLHDSWKPSPYHTSMARGPSAPSSDDPPSNPGPGGPVMRIEEE